MSHTITVELNSSSITQALGKLNQYKTAVARATKNAIYRLCNDSKSVLEAHINVNYVHDAYDDTHSVKVDTSETDGGFLITMTGDAVGFIEFGTGAYSDRQHPFAWDAPFPVYSGSWSDEHAETWRVYIVSGGKKFADSNGEYIYNREPSRPLYETTQWIRDHYAQYFKDEFARIKI